MRPYELDESVVESLTEQIEEQLDFEVEVCNYYYDPGRTNCANDDAYPPETSYDLECDPIEITIDSDIPLDVIAYNCDYLMYTVNGREYEGEGLLYVKDGKLYAEIDPYHFEEEVIEDYVDSNSRW